MKLGTVLSIALLILQTMEATAIKKALIIAPVIDLVGAPIKTFGLASTNKESYELLPFCGGPNQSSVGCPRIHQALCNETVHILSEEPRLNASDEAEVCILYFGAYFITKDNPTPQNMFWTLKKNLISLEKLRTRKQDITKIPATLSFLDEGHLFDTPTLVLVKPYHETTTGKTYSAGTRFIYEPALDTHHSFTAWIFDASITQFRQCTIPVGHAMIEQERTIDESIELFVSLIKSWAHPKSNVIPYVWGGCSYSTLCPDTYFEKKALLKKRKKITIYDRACDHNPCTGLDCAGLILRAAQLAGIPYFLKNTYTLAKKLKPVGHHDEIRNGDLIWIPGHVMIVSNRDSGLLIEARGYSAGFGKVQEIPLRKTFKGITSYQQLMHACYHHEPLIRLDAHGNEIETVEKIMIYSLRSVFDLP